MQQTKTICHTLLRLYSITTPESSGYDPLQLNVPILLPWPTEKYTSFLNQFFFFFAWNILADTLDVNNILKCASNRHFSIPSGHGRGFEAAQLMLLGQMTTTIWWMLYFYTSFIFHTYRIYVLMVEVITIQSWYNNIMLTQICILLWPASKCNRLSKKIQIVSISC